MVQDDLVQEYINKGVKKVRRSGEDIVLDLLSDQHINGNNSFTMKWGRSKGEWFGEHRYSTWESMYPAEDHGPYFHKLDVSDEQFILSAYGIKRNAFLSGSVLRLSPSQLEEIASKQQE